MIDTYKRNLAWGLLLAIFTLSPRLMAAAKSEDQLIQDLASPVPGKVTDALQKLEKEYPTSTKALPVMKKLLTDSRPAVRRKAARVLGVLHADLDEQNIKDICAMLKASDPEEVIDGLKSLRGLKAPQAVHLIIPLLQSPTPNVVRDACRTLAVLGNKEPIASIEPLLNRKEPAIKKDAQDAIFALKAKS